MRNNSFIGMMVLFLTTIMVLSFTIYPEQDSDWKAPESAKQLKNPTQNDKESLSIGKSLYAKHCRSCHGKTRHTAHGHRRR